MALSKVYLLDLKGVATAHYLNLDDCHIYNDYVPGTEVEEDAQRVPYINHPLLGEPKQLQNTTFEQIEEKLDIK